jgi:hypothetical protein
MDELVKGIFTAPVATLFIVAGMLFLLIAVVGNISGKIEPGAKGRLASTVLGLTFVLIGLAIHLTKEVPQMPVPPATPPEQTKPGRPAEAPQTPKLPLTPPTSPMAPESKPQPEMPQPLPAGAQTIFEGVVANVTRFEKTGELVTLELTLQNSTPDTVSFCVEPNRAELIDELTGDSWREAHYGGEVSCSFKRELAMSQSHAVWMKFQIRNPEKKRFALSLPILRRPIENLTLD